MHNNPRLQLKIHLPQQLVTCLAELLQLLLKAEVIEYTNEPHTILINPPKGSNNQWWAAQTYKAATLLGFACLIVREDASLDPKLETSTTPNSFLRGSRFTPDSEEENNDKPEVTSNE